MPSTTSSYGTFTVQHHISHHAATFAPVIRIVHLHAPKLITTDIAHFRELVQKLTGNKRPLDFIDNQHNLQRKKKTKSRYAQLKKFSCEIKEIREESISSSSDSIWRTTPFEIEYSNKVLVDTPDGKLHRHLNTDLDGTSTDERNNFVDLDFANALQGPHSILPSCSQNGLDDKSSAVGNLVTDNYMCFHNKAFPLQQAKVYKDFDEFSSFSDSYTYDNDEENGSSLNPPSTAAAVHKICT